MLMQLQSTFLWYLNDLWRTVQDNHILSKAIQKYIF